jgi:CRISPR system Cascade subunit CasA
MIALFQYALAPASERDVLRLLAGSPPSMSELSHAFAAHADGFDLYGNTPAFQDTTVEAETPSPVGRLLPTSPGEQTRKRNQDILISEISAMRPEIAMLALAFIQAHSPAGGRGTRTSLAGGGPLRTWVLRDTLYATVLANLLPQNAFRELGTPGGDRLDPLPWRSHVHGTRTAANTPPEHVYFACPRRILLAEPEAADPERACGVTGETDVPLITAIRQKANGPEYDSTGWRHPLTPYVQRKQKGVVTPFPKLGATLTLGAAWRERWGLFADVGSAGEPGPVAAAVVQAWRDRRLKEVGGMPIVRVRAFGLRCDNATVASVVDLPFTFRAFPAQDSGDVRLFEEHLSQIVGVGDELANALRFYLIEALHGPGHAGDMPRDWGREHQITFWQRTETDFQTYVADLADALTKSADVAGTLAGPDRQRARHRFQHRTLRTTVLNIFDELCAPQLTAERALDISRARVRLNRRTSKTADAGIDPQLLEAESA